MQSPITVGVARNPELLYLDEPAQQSFAPKPLPAQALTSTAFAAAGERG